ncbi:MAG: AbrB/MazE/SpoVT family DNA-binding domain-containing protein [Nitrososphaerota archaeon]|jgi:AbrB family looped-hinge helix DNA binding protein|nr:AbrB/MazE/SpoVT family DNA-binding domain-containing protein [Nitrososphaerota archaeon]
MTTRSVGPKGQVVIPKHMREALALKAGVEVIFELREKEIIIKKPKINDNYAEYFITTASAKLKKPVNIKELLEDEVNERAGLC